MNGIKDNVVNEENNEDFPLKITKNNLFKKV